MRRCCLREAAAPLRWVPIVLLVLTSCAKPTPLPPRPPVPPDAPAVCPAGASLPKPPPRPRTVEQLGQWARLAALAANATEHARAECAGAYQRLRAWALAPD